MLKSLLQTEKIILIPGTFDALSALIAKQSGFKALYMTGFGVAGSLLAKPDIGLVTASEMVERASQIVDVAEGIPLIADGDNGYGGIHNVSRLVKAYEKAGVQCIQLEDQVIPKRCGHMDNKEVVGLEEATAKIKAAIQSRNSDDFLIAARTDSRATHDLDEALRRGEAFLNAGADILFIEASKMSGKGNLTLTGQLGDVMKESATAALTYVRSHTDILGLKDDFNQKMDIHVHVPAGAIPKDGPSAGIGMVTSIVSSITGIPVRRDVAMLSLIHI